jgi:signal transduction histidine kinase
VNWRFSDPRVGRPAAESEAVRIETVIEPDVGVVQGDSERLQQVVWNLLSNAVKFTPRGGRVEVHLERRDSQMEIRVSDTGKGIQAEFLPHVFDAFRLNRPDVLITDIGLPGEDGYALLLTSWRRQKILQ